MPRTISHLLESPLGSEGGGGSLLFSKAFFFLFFFKSDKIPTQQTAVPVVALLNLSRVESIRRSFGSSDLHFDLQNLRSNNYKLRI